MAIYNCSQCGAILPYAGAYCSSCAQKRANEQRWRNQSSSLSSYVSNGSSSSSNSYTSGAYSASSYRPDNFTGRKSQKFTDGSRYYGDFVDGKRHGKGTNYFADGAQYDGDFKNGYMNGYGLMVYADGEKYDGEWADGKRHGQGTYFYANGAKYEGSWVDGDRHGKGTHYYVNPSGKYVGDFYKDVRHGFGIEDIHVPEGTQHYEGEWQNGKRHGKGKMIGIDGETYEGEYQEGKRHGRGKCVLPDGTVQDGYFENGEFVGAAESTYEVDEEMDISPEVLEQFKQSEAVPTSRSVAKDTNKEIWDQLVKAKSAQKRKEEILASHSVIVIPEGTKRIPGYLFDKCLNLKGVCLNHDISEIGMGDFRGCKNLGPVVVIPKGVKKIYSYAFENCTSLKKIVLPNNITIDRLAFVDSGISDVEFETDPPRGVTVGYGAFKHCDKNMTKEMKDKIKGLNSNAFK